MQEVHYNSSVHDPSILLQDHDVACLPCFIFFTFDCWLQNCMFYMVVLLMTCSFYLLQLLFLFLPLLTCLPFVRFLHLGHWLSSLQVLSLIEDISRIVLIYLFAFGPLASMFHSCFVLFICLLLAAIQLFVLHS